MQYINNNFQILKELIDKIIKIYFLDSVNIISKTMYANQKQFLDLRNDRIKIRRLILYDKKTEIKKS